MCRCFGEEVGGTFIWAKRFPILPPKCKQHRVNSVTVQFLLKRPFSTVLRMARVTERLSAEADWRIIVRSCTLPCQRRDCCWHIDHTDLPVHQRVDSMTRLMSRCRGQWTMTSFLFHCFNSENKCLGDTWEERWNIQTFPFGEEHPERVVQSHVRLQSRMNRKNKQTWLNQIIQNKFLFKSTARGKLGEVCKVTHVRN